MKSLRGMSGKVLISIQIREFYISTDRPMMRPRYRVNMQCKSHFKTRNDAPDQVIMRKFIKIIVEGSGNFWMAWFEGSPDVTVSGQSPSASIDRLLFIACGEHF